MRKSDREGERVGHREGKNEETDLQKETLEEGK